MHDVIVAVAGETPVRGMLGVLQAIISGQQPDMQAVHKLHKLIVSGDITGDVSLCWTLLRQTRLPEVLTGNCLLFAVVMCW